MNINVNVNFKDVTGTMEAPKTPKSPTVGKMLADMVAEGKKAFEDLIADR